MKKEFSVLLLFAIIFVLSLSYVSAYEIFYYHTDNLGSPVLITDENASVVWSADYEPFGKSFNEFGAENSEGNNSYQYNGKELDKSGLFYYGARYYDSDIGRFTTADTIAGNINSPQTLNRYVYVLNNPMKYVDPSGNEPKRALVITAHPSADYNGAFDHFLYTINELIPKGYDVQIDTVSSKEEFFKVFEKRKGEKFDLYVGAAHGSPTDIALHRANILTVNDFEGVDLSSYFNEDAFGLQVSCSVADTTCSNNFAQTLSNAMNIPIEGPTRPVPATFLFKDELPSLIAMNLYRRDKQIPVPGFNDIFARDDGSGEHFGIYISPMTGDTLDVRDFGNNEIYFSLKNSPFRDVPAPKDFDRAKIFHYKLEPDSSSLIENYRRVNSNR